MEQLKKSLTSNLRSERSASTFSRTSSREWLDALEKELSRANPSGGDINMEYSDLSGETANETITSNFGVSDVLKRALNLNDPECNKAADKVVAAAPSDTKKRSSGKMSSFNIFHNRNKDHKKVIPNDEPTFKKELGCVWKVQDVRHSYSDIIYKRRSSNVTCSSRRDEIKEDGKQKKRRSCRSSISSICSISLRESDVLNLPDEFDIGDQKKEEEGDGDGELSLVVEQPCGKQHNHDSDSFSSLASIEERMKRFAFGRLGCTH